MRLTSQVTTCVVLSTTSDDPEVAHPSGWPIITPMR